MKIIKRTTIQIITRSFLYVVLSFGFIQTTIAYTPIDVPTAIHLESPIVELNSNSFNAKKRSGFTIAGQTEDAGRGLTIIHFNTSKKFEHRTFDTHSSEEAAEKLVAVLVKMLSTNSKFAILAHDSAAKSLIPQSGKLAELGFLKLSTLKSRQAYIMHNFKSQIFESVDDITATAKLNIPENISDTEIYFPRIRYEFEPNNNRYIAHAGGEVNGIKSTNTKDALDQNYKKGFRLFELDIIETSDGKLVAAHDWKMWARFTDYSGALPPSHAEFMKHKIYGDYTTLDLKGINAWFAAHPDATLVTDKVNDPVAFANQFVDKDRLVMELFSQMAIEEASRNGIQPMISQTPLMKLKGDKINYLEVNNVKYVALSRRIIANETKLMLKLKEAGIKVYVYNVNFDPGKDEMYVQENEIGLVYGMYADKWVFDVVEKTLSK
ncbi:hypothetical protein [Maribacter sp. 2308TA10-17]|uniref:hypothetical protein n=1 Tax=Maribacter sp. 2308TA10-17 TaxID=3386276 RepID=UPI0039BD4FAD